jgi:2,3-bisphosphoglycerate-dependent phosphoglycerate mutase
VTSIEIVFETHSLTEDNERGIATGWLPGRLSARGRALAAELGDRRRDDRLTAIFSSDLARAVETASIAFPDDAVPLFLDWRLRECDYGVLNGTGSADLLASRREHLDRAYDGGESWRQAVGRVEGFLQDLPTRWRGARILIIGHVATRFGVEHHLNGVAVDRLLAEEFHWQPGWTYEMVP